MNYASLLVLIAAAALLAAGCEAKPKLSEAEWAKIAEDPKALGAYRCEKPAEFANVFSFGYASDCMPKDDTAFKTLLVKLRGAGFNAVHAIPSDARIAICRKLGMKIVVDMLAPGWHMYRDVESAKAHLADLGGVREIWGYSLWNDGLGDRGKQFGRHARNVRSWDRTHPVFVNTEDTQSLEHIDYADVLCYYDYHWGRNDATMNVRHLAAFGKALADQDTWLYRWIAANPGPAGRENMQRCLYTVHTSIAFGLKGVVWFLGTHQMDPKTHEWTPFGRDAAEVNRTINALGPELLTLGNPTAVYSTPITRTCDNKPLPGGADQAMPDGMADAAFPGEFPVQPAAGEFLCGVFKTSDARTTLYLANHNAYAGQNVVLNFRPGAKPRYFETADAKWKPLSLIDNTARFHLPAAGGLLMRLE